VNVEVIKKKVGPAERDRKGETDDCADDPGNIL
jgi:hypothetical protein